MSEALTSAVKLIPGMRDDPERRYTSGGHVAHLIAYGHDYQAQPYVNAYCGHRPQWGDAWRGSGSQSEQEKAAAMPICRKCAKEAAEMASFIARIGRGRCRCVWRGEQCTNQATAEDLLCNWCGNGRPEEMLRADPKAIIVGDTFFGISGGGQLHDIDASKPATTAACWYPDSDRTIADSQRPSVDKEEEK